MIVFKSISIEGFGSIHKPLDINLNSNTINIIKGRNGAGKTTQFSALFWCLYKDALKDIKIDEIATWDKLRDTAWRGTRVILDLSVDEIDYKIARHIKFKGDTLGYKGGDLLLLFKKEIAGYTLLSEYLHLTDQHKFIESLLGMNKTVFINTVLFGQRMSRMVQSSNDDKRQLLEDLFDLQFINQLKEVAKKELTDVKINILQLDSNKALQSQEIANQAKLIDIYHQEYELFKQTKLKNIESLTKELEFLYKEQSALSASIDSKQIESEGIDKEINDFDIDYDSYNSILAKVTEHKKDLHGLKDNRDKFQFSVRKQERELRDVLNSGKTNFKIKLSEIKSLRKESHSLSVNQCFYCKSILNEDKILKLKSEINNKITITLIPECKQIRAKYDESNQELALLLSDLDAEISNSVMGIKEKESLLKGLESKLIASESIQERLKDVKRLKSQMDSTIRELKSLNVTYSDKILKMESNLGDIKAGDYKGVLNEKAIRYRISIAESNKIELDAELESVNSRKERLEWWHTKALSSGGLKSFIFDAMLDVLNQYIEKYADRLGVNINMRVDTDKASKPFFVEIITRGVSVSYESLSGGEKQRIDICISFGLHDLISAKRKINLLIMDEVLEGIDNYGGTEEIFDLIRYKTGKDKTLFLITHSSDVDMMGASEITVEFDGSTTMIV